MSGSAKKLLHAAAGTAASGDPVYVEDVFNVHLYKGTGSTTQSINNGMDLSGTGGLVWAKPRSSSGSNSLYDTERGVQKALISNASGGNQDDSGGGGTAGLYQFNSNGFSLGDNYGVAANSNNADMVAWTFLKQEGFFDCKSVTKSSGSDLVVDFSDLGSIGFAIAKETGGSSSWYAWCKGMTSTHHIKLNETGASSSDNYITVSGTNVTLKDGVYGSGTSMVYAWADGDDSSAQIFGDDGDEAIIKTGTYNGNGSTDVTVDVGFEPQWLMIKRISGNDPGNSQANSWNIFDTTRQWTGTGYDQHTLFWNSNEDEDNNSYRGRLTSTGFVMNESNVSNSGSTYIYMAIRRRMKTPEAGTEVFSRLKNTNSSNDTHDAGFNADVAWIVRQTQNSGNERYMYSRQIGYNRGASLNSDGTFGDTLNAFVFSDEQNKFSSIYIDDTTSISYAFKTAPKVFAHHIVYGTGSGAKTHNHALGVTPEMIIMKYISYSGSSFGKDWYVYHKLQGSSEGYLRLNGNSAFGDYSGHFGSVSSTQFTLNQYLNNAATEPTSVQLFATLAGVSKVGSVSHSGSTDVDCGFSSGARWVMVKRYDSTGDWYVWDTARGIVSGNDPYFLVNNKDNAETTNTDYIDPLSSGFTLTSSFTSGTYIFLAFS